MGKYAVVVCYSFDPETVVYLFDDYQKACEYLQKMWEYCYNTELEEDKDNIDEEGTYHEEDYAQIKWADNESPTRSWQVVGVSEPMKINPSRKQYRKNIGSNSYVKIANHKNEKEPNIGSFLLQKMTNVLR